MTLRALVPSAFSFSRADAFPCAAAYPLCGSFTYAEGSLRRGFLAQRFPLRGCGDARRHADVGRLGAACRAPSPHPGGGAPIGLWVQLTDAFPVSQALNSA